MVEVPTKKNQRQGTSPLVSHLRFNACEIVVNVLTHYGRVIQTLEAHKLIISATRRAYHYERITPLWWCATAL